MDFPDHSVSPHAHTISGQHLHKEEQAGKRKKRELQRLEQREAQKSFFPAQITVKHARQKERLLHTIFPLFRVVEFDKK